MLLGVLHEVARSLLLLRGVLNHLSIVSHSSCEACRGYPGISRTWQVYTTAKPLLQRTKNYNWLHRSLHSMSAQLVQEVDEGVYRRFRSRCRDINIDLDRAVTDALDMWLEHLYYDDSFIERQRKILCEEEFVDLDEI